MKNYFLPYPFEEALRLISEIYWWNNFTHKAFLKPLQIHPSYLSLFLLAAINWNLCIFFNNLKNKKINKVNLISLVGTLAFGILVVSKMAYVVIFILLLMFSLRLIVAKLYRQFFLMILLCVAIFSSIYYALPSIRDRITVDFRNFEQANFKLDNKSPASERIFIWKTCVNIMKEEPLGAFCRNTKKSIWHGMNKSDKYMLEEKNAHNNFLEFGLMYGWFGLSLLFMFIGYSVFLVIKNKDFLLCGMILIFGCYSLVESTLVREAGVIFMAFLFQFHLVTTRRKIMVDINDIT